MVSTLKKIIKSLPFYSLYIQFLSWYKIHIKETVPWYLTQYYIGIILNTITVWYFHRKTGNKLRPNTPIKRILIIGSVGHFDPDHDYTGKEDSQSAIGNILRNIYNSFPNAERIYVHHSEDAYRKDIPPVDMIIGLLCENFIWYSKRHPHAQRVLYLVNSHPLFRINILVDEIRRVNRKLPFVEYASPYIFFGCVRHADMIITQGNEFVRQTFITYGFKYEDIALIDSGVNKDILVPKKELRPNNKLRILYAAGQINIRKGLFSVMEIWDRFNTLPEKNIAELIVFGKPDAYFENDVKEFVSKHPHVTFHPRVDASSQEYRDVLCGSHIILCPSLEEGQVGTVLECMSTGCVPIITPACGIEITEKEGYLMRDPYDIENTALLIAHIASHKDILNEKSEATRAYIESHFDWKKFRKNIITCVW